MAHPPCVMRVSLDVTSAFRLVHHRLVPLIILISYTVIYGHPLLSVYRVLNIIWLYSTIALIICGRSLYT